LCAAHGAKCLELFPALIAEQILYGVEYGARVGFDRDPVLGPQHIEIERRHEGCQGRAGGLVAAHLEPVGAGTQMIGVMDGPAGQPQHLFFQFSQDRVAIGRGNAGADVCLAESCGHGNLIGG
jgi:hypothetical protein